MARRTAKGKKVLKVERTPNYVVEDYKNPPKKQVLGYRTVKTPSGHLVRVAILRKKGPRGGRTVATSIAHPKKEWYSEHRRRSHSTKRKR